jgi:hypothetical protein
MNYVKFPNYVGKMKSSQIKTNTKKHSQELSMTSVVNKAEGMQAAEWATRDSLLFAIDGPIATRVRCTSDRKMWCVSSSESMAEGKHYCEIKIIQMSGFMTIGVAKSDPEEADPEGSDEKDWWAIQRCSSIKQGDRVGILLDLEAQVLQFFVNGVLHNYPISSPITGPVVFSVMMSHMGDSIALLPPSNAMFKQQTASATPLKVSFLNTQLCSMEIEESNASTTPASRRVTRSSKAKASASRPSKSRVNVTPAAKSKPRRLISVSPAEPDDACKVGKRKARAVARPALKPSTKKRQRSLANEDHAEDSLPGWSADAEVRFQKMAVDHRAKDRARCRENKGKLVAAPVDREFLMALCERSRCLASRGC